MILVVASMEIELEGLFGLDRSPDYWEECELRYTGIGRENVSETFDSFESPSSLEGMLSVGFVGSVDPGVKPGDLCLIEAVGLQGGEARLCPDRAFWNRAKKSLGESFRTCELLTVDRTASSLEEKSSLFDGEISVIDRETYWVAEIADEEGVPFLSLRVVIDGADQELPPVYCYDGDTGKVKPGRFTSWLIRNPSRAGGLPRLGWNSVRARRRLGEALDEVVPALLE
ncbi:hypothetical protein K9M78_03210 [Candidatus Bipolaricaulota bacterium]|nr:hypothetical protein [Candidatus Bipolaricaulota bacterium]